MSSIIDTLLKDYKQNTLYYDKLSKEEKRIVELQGKMEHTHLEYQRRFVLCKIYILHFKQSFHTALNCDYQYR